MIHFLVPRHQEFGINEYLDRWGHDLAGRFSIIHYEDLPDRSSLSGGVYVFSALDQLTPQGLRLVRELEAQLRASHGAARVLNSAAATLLRFELSQALRRQGLNRHGAIRAADDPGMLRFPVFVREEHQHSGALSRLVNSRPELDVELARAVLRGFRLSELLVVEYCDTRDTAGWYCRYTAFAVGSEIIPRRLARGREWMVKRAGAEFSEELLREEHAFVMTNPHERELRRIFEIAKVEYGRIDYALLDGAIETWEINLNPTLGRDPVLPPVLEQLRRKSTELFQERFRAAFQGIDSGGSPPGTIPIHYSPESLQARRAMIRRGHRSRFPDAITRIIRPVRPLLERMIRVLAPFVLRSARKADEQLAARGADRSALL